MLIHEIINENISDKWFDNNSVICFKNPTPEKYEIADKDGTIETLEGPVKYKKGYYIMTGPKNEKYPIPPETFNQLKDDNNDGTATPKKIIKVAKIADHDGYVNTSWGEKLNYTKDDDVIIRHGANDYGVIKKDIFNKTYSRIKEG